MMTGNVQIDETSLARSAPSELRSRANVAATAQVVFIILAAFGFAYVARAVVLPVLLACGLAITLKAPMDWLRQCRLPAPVAAAFVVGVCVAAAAFSAVHLGRPAVEWLSAAPENLPRIQEKFGQLLRPAARLTRAASTVSNLAASEPARAPQPVEVKDNHVANTVFTWTSSLLAGAVETVALLFLLLAAGDLFLYKLVRALPRLRDKKQAVEISRQIRQSISTYLFSVSLINIGFGLIVGLAFYVIGMPNAMMWGGVAAFANFIPYIGPTLCMLAIALAGLLAYDTLGQGVLPVAAYGLAHLVEAFAVSPLVLGRRFALNPVAIFLALIFFTWLWGMLGSVFSMPLLVTAKVICDRVPSLGLVSELLAPGAAPDSASEAKAPSIPRELEPCCGPTTVPS